MHRRLKIIIATTAWTFALTGCSSAALWGGSNELAEKNPQVASASIEMHRESGCGCCVSWADYLRKHGASVDIVVNEKLENFRTQQGVSKDASSCHTALVEGYVVEGHVPVGAIDRLLEVKPDAVGIAMPGMPASSPGMGGVEAEWEKLPVMLINNDGSLTPFRF